MRHNALALEIGHAAPCHFAGDCMAWGHRRDIESKPRTEPHAAPDRFHALDRAAVEFDDVTASSGHPWPKRCRHGQHRPSLLRLLSAVCIEPDNTVLKVALETGEAVEADMGVIGIVIRSPYSPPLPGLLSSGQRGKAFPKQFRKARPRSASRIQSRC